MKVDDVMVEKVITVKDGETVKRAVDIMNKHEIGCLVVEKDGSAVGILTERDLMKRVLAKCKDPQKIKVQDVMTQPLMYVSPKTDVEQAAKIMFKLRIKKLPVIEDTRLVGLVTVTDIARSSEKTVRMLKEIFNISPLQRPTQGKPVKDYVETHKSDI